MLRRVLSLFLAMTLLLSNVPVVSFAEELDAVNENLIVAQNSTDLSDSDGGIDENIDISGTADNDVHLEQQDELEINKSDVAPILEGTTNNEPSDASNEGFENEFVSVSGVYLSESEIHLTIEDKPIQLLVTVVPENADNQTIAWSSSNPEVATVVDGVVTPLTAGMTTVTAVSNDGDFSASCLITVTDPVETEEYSEIAAESISLGESELILAVGETATLTATSENVTWTSSNDAVATVEDGVVKAIAMGKATITATAGEESATCNVTVNGVWGDQVQWYFDVDTGLLTISGSGDLPNCKSSGSDAPWYQYKSSTVKVEIKEGITSIGNNTFRSYTTLEEVALPDTLIKIGTYTFSGATKLSSIPLNKVESIGNAAFSGCAKLTSVSLDSVRTIDAQAFATCSGLTSVTLGSEAHRVETIGKQAFGKCAALGTVLFKNVKTIGEEAFVQSGLTSADLTGVETIGKKAFYQDKKLTTVTFGTDAINIGSWAFASTGLTSVAIPGTATVGMCAFISCAQLTEAVIGEGVTTIPGSCFESDAALESVTLPVSLTTVEADAFCDCSGLKTVHYAGTQEQWNTVSVDSGNDSLTALMNKGSVAVTGVSLDKAKLELKVNDEPEQLLAVITPSDATNNSVVWTSCNEQVATVDAIGKVTPIGIGDTIITVTTNDGGFQATCNVKVIGEDGDLKDVDLTKFLFTLYNSEIGDSIYADSSLTINPQDDGSYTLRAPSYAVEYTRGTMSLTVQAPEDFQVPFSVTYTCWDDGTGTEKTIQSDNGSVCITGYYNGRGKQEDGLVDYANGLLYSDFTFEFEGSDTKIPVSFLLYNTLRTVIIENQATSERPNNISRTNATTFELHLFRGESYMIYVEGGFKRYFAASTCSISDGTDTVENVRNAKIIYTPGEETSKDFEVRITSREPSYGIVDGVYKLHVIVDDAPENKPIFEKYIYTLNGQEYEPEFEETFNRYCIPEIAQFDKLSIKAVVNNVDAGAIYNWTGRVTTPGSTGDTIEVDTTSSSNGYGFGCTVVLPSGYTLKLPRIYVGSIKVTSIPAPTIITEPVGGEYPVGAQVSLSVLVAYPESGVPQFQWYQCDDENGNNAVAIEDATNSTRKLNGYESIYLAPSNEVGAKWYYCEVYSSYGELSSTKVTTKCVKVEIVKNMLPLQGEGTSNKPYLITCADDLIAIREAVADGNAFVGQYFQFEKDVTLPDGWQPIGCTKDGSDRIDSGSNLNAFSGIINGAGHTLTVPVGGLPLLGYVWGATVRDLNIYGTQIAGYGLVNNYHGVGLNGTAIVIENVTLKEGTQTLKAGLIGAELNSENGFSGASASCQVTIRNCTVEKGVVIGYAKDQSMIGAIAGRLHGVIENCKSSATVYGVNYVGGILGCRDNAMGLCSVSGCSFDGSVVASGDHAGGIVGGGYTNQTAPNGIKVTANNNTVTGSVTGRDKVGGILGGDTYVAQAWNGYSFKANSFSGTVKATGGSYVGGIIGYYKSLNMYDDILGNTYSGTDRGIGFVWYVDTNCETATGMDGTVIINSGNGTDNLPKVEGCAWRADHNRTDDPLGKDVDKLFRKVGSGEVVKPTCYEIRVSGSYQTEYTVGDELNLSGIKLTAVWTDGTTTELKLSDVEISGYDKNKAGEQTISLSYGLGKAQITVTVKPKSSKITVSVSIMGDAQHTNPNSNGGPHGYARGGLTPWLSESNVEADTAETVWDVLKRVGQKKGITFNASDNNQYNTVYISAVNGLGEFDNGPKSGWMYTVNGSHPNVGVSAKYLSNGDNIILHYTDDFDYEEGGVKYGQPVEDTSTAKAVIDLIDKIGNVTYTDECKQKIDTARSAYDALPKAEKDKVTNYKKLTEAEKKYEELKVAADKAKAKSVDDLIDKIGTVTINSGVAITNAWNGYNGLTSDQQRYVTKLDKLREATQKWNQLKADEVIKLIDKIEDPVTEKSNASIGAARKAYDNLTSDQKKLVTNVKKLTDAEKAYAQLTATPEDKEKAQKVIDLINKLTDVTLDSEKDVEAARKAYDALTDLQKLLVDNYDILVTAETKLAMLKALGKVSDPYITTGDYMEALGTPGVGSTGGEWMVIGLARSGRNVPGVEDYYQKVVEYVKSNIDPDTGRLHKAKSTDNSRIIMALTAIGKDVTNVGGYNLLAGLSDFEYVKYQGNNGPIWALLALDSGNYPVPSGGTTTRQALIEELLRIQTSDGGWAVSGDKADSDMTGMALTALAPYYKKDLKVQQAIDKAITCLSEMQDDDGGFSTTYSNGEHPATSESISQVVTALSALGINADTDPRFIKNGSSVIDALLRYYVEGGGFRHIMDGDLDGIATEQAYYALTAYYRFLTGQTNLYDMTDIIDMGGDPVEPTVPATTEPTEVEPAKTGFPWWILVVCVVGGCGLGMVIAIVIIPKFGKFKKKD